jgi:hypothetical protein
VMVCPCAEIFGERMGSAGAYQVQLVVSAEEEKRR